MTTRIKIHRQHITLAVLSLILLFGFIIRVYHISDVPHGFFTDEAAIGYNAYTIGTSGRDEYGNFLPLFFRSFGDYKSPVAIYSTVPLVMIFGLNETSVRLVSAAYGTLTILAIFLLTTQLIKNKRYQATTALLASLMLAISPWHVHMSRLMLEAIMPYVFFTTLGLYLFLKAQKNIYYLYLSVIAFTLSLYSYFPAKIFVPIILLSMIIIFWSLLKSHLKTIFWAFLLFVILMLPMAYEGLFKGAFSRFDQVSIFTHPPIDQTILHHIVSNYLSHFSLDFLFFKGDAGMQVILRHSTIGMGELYLFQLPFILFGLYGLYKMSGWKYFSLVVTWLIFYPLGSIFTTDSWALATRSVIGVIPFQLLCAFGIAYTVILLKKILPKLWLIGPILLINIIQLFSFLAFLNLYLYNYPLVSSGYWGWQFGAKDSLAYFTKQQNNYDEMFLYPAFNSPSEFIRFYTKDTCPKCSIGSFDQYNKNKKQLFAIPPDYLYSQKKPFSIKNTIYYPDHRIAFLIGEVK